MLQAGRVVLADARLVCKGAGAKPGMKRKCSPRVAYTCCWNWTRERAAARRLVCAAGPGRGLGPAGHPPAGCV